MDIKITLGLLLFPCLDTAMAASTEEAQLVKINKCRVENLSKSNDLLLSTSDRGYDADRDEAIEDLDWDKIILNDRTLHVKKLQPSNQYYTPEQYISQLVLILFLLTIITGSLRWMF